MRLIEPMAFGTNSSLPNESKLGIDGRLHDQRTVAVYEKDAFHAVSFFSGFHQPVVLGGRADRDAQTALAACDARAVAYDDSLADQPLVHAPRIVEPGEQEIGLRRVNLPDRRSVRNASATRSRSETISAT